MTVESADVCDRCASTYEMPTWSEPCPLCAKRVQLLTMLRKRRVHVAIRAVVDEEWRRNRERIMRDLLIYGRAYIP
jgi:hypothetical protein